MSHVQLNALRKSYGRDEVIHGIDLEIREGEFIVFVGPSGCGKSTLLRMLAGLEEITQGELMIGGRRANGLTPTERGIAMVFQNYALYPHMTVAQNIGFGLKMLGMSKADIEVKVAEAAAKLRLTEYLGRKPAALSGGQRQRVAIGRAIVRDPALFLFDEPLSNLDAELRVSMRIEIARLHREIGVTMVYVTHDQTEAMTLADRIVVLNAGRIEQVGTPQELYERPANLFVAGFMGSPAMNFLPDEAVPRDARTGHGTRPAARFGIRPEHLQIRGDGPARMKVEAVEYLGGTRYVYGSLNGAPLIVEKREGDVPGPGESIALHVPPDKLHLFDAEGLRVG